MIETDKGSVTLERTIGKKKIIVTSNNPSIKSDTYTLKEIGTVLLSLIGIDNSPMIIKNSRYEQVRLTWRTFMHTFLINEEEVIQQQPILISKESTAKTASISSLLYLISAPDFSLFNATEDKKIREARKRAVENYISNEINTLSEQKKSLDKLIKDINPSTAEQEIQRLDDELSEIERCIAKEISYSKGTLSRIIAERDRLAECDLLLNRYAELRSQYQHALLELERGYKFTREDMVDFIMILLQGDVNDKNYQQKIIDNLVFAVIVEDDEVIALFNLRGGKAAEKLDLDIIEKIRESIFGFQTRLPLARHKRRSNTKQCCFFVYLLSGI